jgi:hypothetical protein
MARSLKKRSKKGSSKSPKNTRKEINKATSPKIDFNNEDYNIRSPERTQLLTQIKEAIGDAPVSSAFWACFQLADMNQLNRLLAIAKESPQVLLVNDNPSAFLPLQCELPELYSVTVDMLTMNRESAIQGFRSRDSLATSRECKEAQTEF